MGACGCLFLFSPSHSAKGGEEQMDNLCTEAPAEILSWGQGFVTQLFKEISYFSYVLEISLLSFMLQRTIWK